MCAGSPPLALAAAGALVLASALLASAAPLRAAQGLEPAGVEPGSVSFDAGGGLALAAGTIDEMTGVGFTFGGAVSLHLTRHLALRGGVDYQRYDGASGPGGTPLFPDLRALHLGGGFELNLYSEEGEDAPWTTTLHLGAGLSNLNFGETLDDGTPVPPGNVIELFDYSYPAVQGGAKLGYQAGPAVNLYLEPKAYLVLTGEEDTGTAFAALGVPGFRTAWLFPLQAGVRIRL